MPDIIPTAFNVLSHLILITTLLEMLKFHFTDEETKVWRSNFSKITDLAINTTKIQSQGLLDSGVWSPKLYGSLE